MLATPPKLPIALAISVAAASGAEVGAASNQRARSRSGREVCERWFPMEPGTTWSYQILLNGSQPPIAYEEIIRDMAGQTVRQTIRRTLIAPSQNDGVAGKAYVLRIGVRGPGKREGILSKYAQAVELVVHRDDLGLFPKGARVYWGVVKSESFVVHLVLQYPSRKPDTCVAAVRPIFFSGDRAGSRVPSSEGSPESLTFEGIAQDPELPFLEALRFVRRVAPTQPQARPGQAGRGLRLVETTWFTGAGLVRLEQHVDGVMPMEWRLASFSLGGVDAPISIPRDD